MGLQEILTDPITKLPDLVAVYQRVRTWLGAGDAVGILYYQPLPPEKPSAQGEERSAEALRALADCVQQTVASLDQTGIEAQPASGGDELYLFLRLPCESLYRLRRAAEAIASCFGEGTPADPNQPRVKLVTGLTLVHPKQGLPSHWTLTRGMKQAREMSLTALGEGDEAVRAELESLICEGRLGVVFQPLVDLRHGEVHGYEALIRGPAEGRLRSPAELFGAAATAGLTSELEAACLRAIKHHTARLRLGVNLFVNLSPQTVAVQAVRTALGELLAEATPGSMVLEVTEGAWLSDIPELTALLASLRERSMLLAVDDLGAGYANLLSVAQVKPHYLKVDRSIVNNVHRSTAQQALVQAVVQLARQVGARVVAEGIEDPADLREVLRLGVDFGQGYYLGHPASELATVQPHVVAEIQAAQRQKSEAGAGDGHWSIEHILTNGHPVSVDTQVTEVMAAFERESQLTSAVVVSPGGEPLGLIMKDKLFDRMIRPHLNALYARRGVEIVMDRRFATVHRNDSLGHVAQVAVTRGGESQYDDLVVVDKRGFAGIIPLRKLLETLTHQQIAKARATNPLTGLPGNTAIGEHLASHLATPDGVFLYIDIDAFKGFNDHYGFSIGDEVIGALARVLKSAADAAGPPRPFVGHIGGDDFVATCTRRQGPDMIAAIRSGWGREAARIQDYADSLRKTVNPHNGTAERHPLTISTAVVDGADAGDSVDLLALRAALAKQQAKAITGNSIATAAGPWAAPARANGQMAKVIHMRR